MLNKILSSEFSSEFCNVEDVCIRTHVEACQSKVVVYLWSKL